MNFILGKKVKMTQIFQEDGKVIPVTEISVEPSTVIRTKTVESDGYNAVVLAYGKRNKVKKSILGLFKNLGKFNTIKEFRIDEIKDLKAGDQIGLNGFNVGDRIKITSYSKGKGFQGVVKRHGFGGALQTHGTKDQLRMPGSIGATASARVFRGVRMAGRMGNDKVTIDNLQIVKIDLENNLLYIKGAVAGGPNALLTIKGNGDLKLYEAPKAEEKKEEIVENAPEVLVSNDDSSDIPEVAATENAEPQEALPEVASEEKVEEVKEEAKSEEEK